MRAVHAVRPLQPSGHIVRNSVSRCVLVRAAGSRRQPLSSSHSHTTIRPPAPGRPAAAMSAAPTCFLAREFLATSSPHLPAREPFMDGARITSESPPFRPGSVLGQHPPHQSRSTPPASSIAGIHQPAEQRSILAGAHSTGGRRYPLASACCLLGGTPSKCHQLGVAGASSSSLWGGSIGECCV